MKIKFNSLNVRIRTLIFADFYLIYSFNIQCNTLLRHEYILLQSVQYLSLQLQRLTANLVLKIWKYHEIINSCRNFELFESFPLKREYVCCNNFLILVLFCLYSKHIFQFKNKVHQKCTSLPEELITKNRYSFV